MVVLGPQHVSNALHQLSRCERALLENATSTKRVEAFALGRLAAKRALGRIQPSLGKQALIRVGNTRAPQWPKGMYGAISHHQGWAAAVVDARGFGVGIDLQAAHLCHANLAKRILRPVEYAYYLTLLPTTAVAWLLSMFSIKESLYKALQPTKQGWWGFQQGAVSLRANGLRHSDHAWRQPFAWQAFAQSNSQKHQGNVTESAKKNAATPHPLARGQGICWRKNAWVLSLCWVD